MTLLILKERKNLEESIRSYIDNKLPGVAIRTVNVMLGALIVATLPFNVVEAKAASTIKSEYSQVMTSKYIDYTVKSGDTLYKIAVKYGMTVGLIKNANNLSEDMIFVRQVLKIPTEIDYFKHYVKAGDTLYIISQQLVKQKRMVYICNIGISVI